MSTMFVAITQKVIPLWDFDVDDIERILQKFSIPDLKAYHATLCGCSALSGWTKAEIITHLSIVPELSICASLGT